MDPAIRTRLREAVDLALAGDWQAAHLIAQDHDRERLANWIHAIAHRMEGDEANADYWYRRCGRADLAPHTVDAELRMISAALDAG
jgi:hypothetical protein